MPVPILKLHQVLIAPLRGDLTDSQWEALRAATLEAVGKHQARGVVLDVTALEVLDSYATKTLQGLAHMIRLRGAHAVVTGIRPAVALAMVQLGLDLQGTDTALDLETGLDLIHARLDAERAS